MAVPPPAQLSLIAAHVQPLPQALPDVIFEVSDAGQFVLRSGAREWRALCVTWQLHRDVGAAFYAAIPPRRAPLSRRLSWRVLLGIAGTGAGRWLLSRRAR